MAWTKNTIDGWRVAHDDGTLSELYESKEAAMKAAEAENEGPIPEKMPEKATAKKAAKKRRKK